MRLIILLFALNLWQTFQAQELDSISSLTVANSAFLEGSVSLSEDGLFMVIVTTREGMPWYQKDDYNLMYLWRENVSSEWQEPFFFDSQVNNHLNQDYGELKNRYMLFESWTYDWKTKGGPFTIIEVDRSATKSPPNLGPSVLIGGAITEFFVQNNLNATDGMTLLDDLSIIFAAGPAYDEAMDLYYAEHLGDWSYATPIKLSCNTPDDERTPFLSADNSTLYFASDRAGSIGGLDVFKILFSEKLRNTDGETFHIGKPLNTNTDEKGFVSYNEKEAYFVRDGDIFKMNNLSPEVVPFAPSNVRTEISDKPIAGDYDQVDLRSSDTEKGEMLYLPQEGEAKDAIRTTQDTRGRQDDKSIASESNSRGFVSSETHKTKSGPLEEDFAPAAEITNEDLLFLPNEPGTIGFKKENNMVFTVDVSSSMDQPDRLPLMQSTIKKIMLQLREKDYLSVISFNDRPEVILNGITKSFSPIEVGESLDSLKAFGNTFGLPALQKAYDYSKVYKIPSGNNVVILATDGRLKDKDKLDGIVRRYARNGIKLVVLTYGNPGRTTVKRFKELTRMTGGFHANISKDLVEHYVLTALGAEN